MLLPSPKLMKCGSDSHAVWAIYVMKRPAKNNTPRRGAAREAGWLSETEGQRGTGSRDTRIGAVVTAKRRFSGSGCRTARGRSLGAASSVSRGGELASERDWISAGAQIPGDGRCRLRPAQPGSAPGEAPRNQAARGSFCINGNHGMSPAGVSL